MVYILIIFGIFLFYRIVKPYFVQYDTTILCTGGLGSGKSLYTSSLAMKLLRRNRFKVWLHNIRHPFNKWEKPLLYSNIAFRVSKREWAVKLTEEHMLMQRRIVPGSVLFVDEICLFLDQFSIKIPASEVIEEFATLFRHYSSGGYLGGYFVANTQNSNKVNFHFRYCMNSALNLTYFKKWLPIKFLWLFCTVKVRNISLADDIKKIEENNKEDSMSTLFFWRPFFKHYDTYTYSIRYKDVPQKEETVYKQFKTGTILKCPKTKIEPLTHDVEIEEEKSILSSHKLNLVNEGRSIYEKIFSPVCKEKNFSLNGQTDIDNEPPI